MIHVGSNYRGLCTQCQNPPAYQWHLYGHLVYQCRFGHSWLAWKDVYLTNKNKNTKS